MKHLMFLLALGLCLSASLEPTYAAPPDGGDELCQVVELEDTAEVFVVEASAAAYLEVAVMGEVVAMASGELVDVERTESFRTTALLPDPLPDILSGRGYPERWCGILPGEKQGRLRQPARAGPVY